MAEQRPFLDNVLLDVAGAAAYLGVSPAFVRRLVLEKRVSYYKVGKYVRFRAADLEAFIEFGRVEPIISPLANFPRLARSVPRRPRRPY